MRKLRRCCELKKCRLRRFRSPYCDRHVIVIFELLQSNTSLAGIDLRGVNLESGNLSGVNLNSTNLRGARLTGANLKGAYLFTDLSKTEVTQDHLVQAKSLNGATMPDGTTHT